MAAPDFQYEEFAQNLAAQALRGGLVAVALYGPGILLVKLVDGAQHRGVQKPEEGIELREVVLDGRTAEGYAVTALQ